VLKSLLISLIILLLMVLIFGVICGWCGTVRAAGAGIVRGAVTDSDTGEPLARVTVRVQGTGFSTLTNDNGQYRLVLAPGSYELKFTHISYYSEPVVVNLEDTATVRDVAMRPSVTDIGTMRVYTRAYDPAQQIIVEAIRRKKSMLDKIHDYRFHAYTKFVLNDESRQDSSEIFLLAESQTTGYWEQPDKYKEIITARKQSANLQSGNILIAVGGMLNFNRDRIEIGDYLLVSPTANDALDHYDFYLIDTITVDGRPVYRLELEPKDSSEALFTGVIHIVDSTYDLVMADLGFSKGTKFPFLVNPRYSQTYARFENDCWMPVEIRLSADVDINAPLPGIPSRLSFLHSASLYDFRFDQGIPKRTFDEYFLEVAENADNVDTAAWNARQTIPLTEQEILALQRIDSVENAPRSFGQRLARVGLGLSFLLVAGQDDIFHFNRVEGPYVGAGLTLRRLVPRARFRIKSGYAFDGEYWQHHYGVTYQFDRWHLSVGGDYHDEVIARESAMSSDGYNRSLLALLYKVDSRDFYLERGFRLSASFRPLNFTRLRLGYADCNHWSTPVHTDYSLFRRDMDARANLAVAEGKYRTVTVGFTYDSRRRFKIKGEETSISNPQYTILDAGAEHASPDFIDNDFDFTRYHVSLFRRQRLFSLGVSSLYVYGGWSERSLPPQRFHTVGHASGILFEIPGFNTLHESNFVGTRALAAFVNHDFGDLPFARSGLPLLTHIPFTLSLHGGVFRTELDDRIARPKAGWYNTAPTEYTEAGLGLANLTPFLMPLNMALYFTWQLSDYDTDRFQLTWGIKL